MTALLLLKCVTVRSFLKLPSYSGLPLVQSADTAIVQVTSGKVQFSAIGQPDAVILTGGMAAQVTEEQPDVQVIKERKAGSFIFDNAPLPKVLEELSRYYKVKLSASNENKRLTASFKNKSLDEIIRFIEKVLNVKIEKVKQ